MQASPSPFPGPTSPTSRRTAGRYILTRELPAGLLGPRWLGLDQEHQSSHLVQVVADRTLVGRFADAARLAQSLRHRHILAVEDSGEDADFGPWVAGPFTGDQDGVLTLTRLLKLKGGVMDPVEARRAIGHLLEAASAGFHAGLSHGPITPEGVSVTRGGSIQVEFYGLPALLAGTPVEEARRAEIRSIAALGYQLVTGMRVDEPYIPAGRVVERLHPTWDDWFETSLGPTGFTTPAHALYALGTCRVSFEQPAPGRRAGP